MRKLTSIVFIAAMMCVTLTAQAGGKGRPFIPCEDVAIATTTKAAAQAAILTGAAKRGWTPQVISPELVRCQINVRNKHKVVVEVPHTEKSFSIRYVSSENMNYNAEEKTIHRNYNNWVANLSSAIQEAAALTILTKEEVSPTAKTDVSDSSKDLTEAEKSGETSATSNAKSSPAGATDETR